MNWETVKLGEVCNVLPGFAFKSSLMGDEGIPVLKIKNINDNLGVDTHNCQGIGAEHIPEKLSKFYVEKGDILLAMTGATAGKFGRISAEGRYLLNQRVAKIIPVKADANYIWSCLSDSAYRNLLYNMGQGAAQPNVSGGQIEALEIPLPPLPVQQKIAGILSAYDDLIDNNRKRIALLEKAVRLLYEEWFVRLQFPGHEHTPVVDGVPEGWEKASVKSICYEVKDAVHPNQIEAGAAYIGLEHMPRKSITLQEWGQPEDVSSLKYRYSKGDILFGKIRPYFHKVGFTLNSGICSTDAIVLRPTQEKYYSLLLMYVSSESFVNEATQSSNGTKMPRANWKHLEKLEVCIAPDVLLETFSGYIKPILLQLENAAAQNQKLQAARDLLLPRLMSGELAV